MVVDTYHVPALDAPIEILIDEWGIPHIYAQSPRDAYLAQGFAAARDRLWQMDLWRKRGLGRLAENFGPAYAEADRARRMFLYRGDMATEWAAYGPGVSEIAVAFVEGINAYVDVIERGDASLPPEFGWTDSRPVRWKPEDIVSIRSVGLRSNVQDELARVRLEALGHSYLDHARRRRSPPRDINSPSGYDPRAISSDALALYLRALAEPSFSERSVQPAADQTMATASNVWALAPNRTTTGRPLLANDPHRLHSMPSLRWLVHLDAPGLSAIGATEPVHPGISSGHNGAMAFGYTYSACDQEDLFIHSLRDGRFRTEGGWQDFDVVEEVVAVRDEDCQRFTLKYAGKNPVLFEDEQAGYCVILKSAFLEPGGAPYFAGVNYHQSTDLADFNERLSYAGAPTMNYVGADTDGNIGAFVRGFVPKRDGWDGGTPAFGDDGIASWQGFCAHDALPTERDPACGWVGNCNQVPLPGNFDHDRLSLGQEFSDDVRFRRLADLIETKTRHSLADVADYQCDQRLAYAPEMMASLLASSPTLPPLFTAQLSAWEGDISIGSAEAAFFIVWLERHLRPAVLL